MAIVLGAIAKIAFISIHHTSDTYLGERAKLFMLSSIENAILAIEGYNRKNHNDCLTNINFIDEDNRFEANISVLRYYCYDLNDCACKDTSLVQKIKTDKSHGNVLLKIVVKSNLKNPKNNNKQIRIVKTTLQRL